MPRSEASEGREVEESSRLRSKQEWSQQTQLKTRAYFLLISAQDGLSNLLQSLIFASTVSWSLLRAPHFFLLGRSYQHLVSLSEICPPYLASSLLSHFEPMGLFSRKPSAQVGVNLLPKLIVIIILTRPLAASFKGFVAWETAGKRNANQRLFDQSTSLPYALQRWPWAPKTLSS